MTRKTPETLLISAMLNSGDVLTAQKYGVSARHFIGYRDEFEWIVQYYERFNQVPSIDQFTTQFADFPVSDESEGRWPAEQLKRKQASRMLTKACQEAMSELKSDNLEEAYHKLSDLTLDISTAQAIDLLKDNSFLDNYDEPLADRMRVPWPTLQGYTLGIGKQELWYLAARQGQGKSQLLIATACEALMQGHNVCMYSLEMRADEIATRFHATLGFKLGYRVNQMDMRARRFDRRLYKELLQDIQEKVPGNLSLVLGDDGKVSPSTVVANADRGELHVVDYAGLMYTDDGRPAVSDWRSMAEISNSLKRVAKSRDIAILAASQVNREGDTPGMNPPRMKNLAQSDHLGNDGDVVITMKRLGDNAAACSLEKNRNGESARRWWMKFDPNEGDFTEISVDDVEEMMD